MEQLLSYSHQIAQSGTNNCQNNGKHNKTMCPVYHSVGGSCYWIVLRENNKNNKI